ncbi:MAG: citrate/2-methylcitrate synthase [Clostridia bacterium]|nr:citrate/2-methylcitrate synthase [Clostridia bacterium]
MRTNLQEYTAEDKEFIGELIDTTRKTNHIPPELYGNYNVKRGLRNADGTGVLVGLTVIGEVHGYIIEDSDRIPAKGRLLYRGIDVEDLVKGCQREGRFGYEETCYLLLFGVLPDEKQLNDFKDLLNRLRNLPNGFVEDMIIKAPSKNIMNKLARCVLALYSYDESPDDLSINNVLLQCLNLIAKFPSLIANSYSVKRRAFENDSLVLHAPHPTLSASENFLYMLRPDQKYTRLEAEILDLCMIVHAEHGGGNNSAFTTHVVSSSGTDTYAAISAAISSLKGPKHGGAALAVQEMFSELKENVKDWADEREVDAYLTKIIRKEAYDRSGLIYGMGHAIYTISDPRAVLLKEKARELAIAKGREKEFALYELVEHLSPLIFNRERKSSKTMCANVDFYSGFIYNMLGIPQDLYTPLFAMSRIVGWSAHRLEELMSGGKIIRPAYKSIAHRSQYVSLEKRSDRVYPEEE